MTQSITHTRAKKGGEVGMNGERYEGGQFLPSTTLPKMQARKTRKGSGKQEIAPYKWEVPPEENQKSIFKMIGGTVATYNHDNGMLKVVDNPATLEYFGMDRDQVQKLVDLYNSGERWIDKGGSK